MVVEQLALRSLLQLGIMGSNLVLIYLLNAVDKENQAFFLLISSALYKILIITYLLNILLKNTSFLVV